MIIKKYNIFLEARLSDILKLNIDKESPVSSQIKKMADMDFEFNKKLIKYITLNKRIGRNKIQLTIDWYNTDTHSIYKRIKERTSFKSIEEFNEFFKSTINKVLPDSLGTDLLSSNRYSIYSKEYNISIIIHFDLNKFINGDYVINVITILPGKIYENVSKIIEV